MVEWWNGYRQDKTESSEKSLPTEQSGIESDGRGTAVRFPTAAGIFLFSKLPNPVV
jgi:hypothetical protein